MMLPMKSGATTVPCCLAMPRAYMAMILSSKLLNRRACLAMSSGSKLPLRFHCTSIGTGPWPVKTVLAPVRWLPLLAGLPAPDR